ncbi:MAG: hypothetical protein KDC49_00950 [Saprospiraceae bacterium]|nr:hypothetical protein [Saprospiraceae bacterium]
MSFFRSLFGKDETFHLPNLKFGRFTEHRLSVEKITKWDDAVAHFEKKDYTKSYISLLEYIENEENTNLSFKEKLALRMSFELKHGSKMIFGYSNQNGFFATAKLVHVSTEDASLYKMLLEENYALRYTRYAIDDEQNLVVMLHFDHSNASPLNLFRALREMAIICDTKDDIILADFPGTSPVNMEIQRSASPQELKLKYNYFKDSLDSVIEWYESSEELVKKQPGLALFAFLGTLYKIDYLVKPEGKIQEKINDIHKYYHHRKLGVQVKTTHIAELVRSLSEIEKTSFDQEIYDTILTFGMLRDCNTEKAAELIAGELHYASWYIQKNYLAEAGFIMDYIASHLLFSHNLPKTFRQCLHLYLEVMETSFFEKIGYTYFSKRTGLPKKKAIVDAINVCLKNNNFSPDEFPLTDLNFSNKTLFAFSMLQCISKTNFDD